VAPSLLSRPRYAATRESKVVVKEQKKKRGGMKSEKRIRGRKTDTVLKRHVIITNKT
jgi:hypothetical protein